MEEKINIAVSGGAGLVGSRLIQLLSPKYNLKALGRSDGFDVTDAKSFTRFDEFKFNYFLHLAAKADVDGSESEKELGEKSQAWIINVNGTKNVSDYCRKKNIRLIYVSTDFVFDGRKPEGDFYTEEDVPNPLNYYAVTKYEGEKIVAEDNQNLIVRIAYPYRKEFDKKKDFVRSLLDRLRQGESLNAVTDHIICPTFIDDIAFSIDSLIENKVSGIYHAVGSQPITPYDAVLKIAEKFGLNKNLIKPTTREEFFRGKAQRPFNLYLKNDKIKNLGVNIKTFDEGLEELSNL